MVGTMGVVHESIGVFFILNNNSSSSVLLFSISDDPFNPIDPFKASDFGVCAIGE